VTIVGASHITSIKFVMWNSSTWNMDYLRLRTKTDPVFETLCVFLEYQTMEKVQKLSNPDCNTPSSEPFKINLQLNVCFSNWGSNQYSECF
jgi:hypothetical protein